jgi:hypothetical protein
MVEKEIGEKVRDVVFKDITALAPSEADAPAKTVLKTMKLSSSLTRS